MTLPIIGYSQLVLTPSQQQRLSEAACRLGYELRPIPKNSLEPADYAGCSILVGIFPLAALELAADLRWFHSCWAGVDDILPSPAVQEGRVILTTSSGAYGDMIGEYLLAGALSLLRHLPAYYQAQQEKRWLAPIPACSFRDRVVAVVGLGDVGMSFARRAAGLGAIVRGVRRSDGPCPPQLAAVYTIDQLDDALEGADILALTLPATKDTNRLIDGGRLSLLAPGAILLNAGRGSVLNTEHLLAALDSGHLAGAMLDVFDEEPLPAASPLWTAPNLLLTPHISGKYEDPLPSELVLRLFLEQLELWSQGRPLLNRALPQRGY